MCRYNNFVTLYYDYNNVVLEFCWLFVVNIGGTQILCKNGH